MQSHWLMNILNRILTKGKIKNDYWRNSAMMPTTQEEQNIIYIKDLEGQVAQLKGTVKVLLDRIDDIEKSLEKINEVNNRICIQGEPL